MKTLLIILAVVASSLLVSPNPAPCSGICTSNTCVNSNQCGLTCACVVPYFGRLGTCQQVRIP